MIAVLRPKTFLIGSKKSLPSLLTISLGEGAFGTHEVGGFHETSGTVGSTLIVVWELYFVSSGPWKFKNSHLIRALKAAKKAGFLVEKAVINAAGEIVLIFSNGTTNDDPKPNPWNVVYAKNQKRSS